jgi:hypothetical protein
MDIHKSLAIKRRWRYSRRALICGELDRMRPKDATGDVARRTRSAVMARQNQVRLMGA